eukprot:CAMPEP_0198307582 /NCGR_PEP_ID=MMETSP1450-20131203/426_1 /TAXON_ID=753684 ORGANISM="Madagascaria erythrocladiodes, Strain CCMP3234" /NCGR_SAMPLE_ID=MMETSP1450 /ASSEMBLY_ACC=CAM_ASM_001115 /LENGTH=372 /DNA_ID=CAMNT_0044010167 /DNA_START=74 /DNA_END=1192 /DNA_ORIENTATION=+
MSGGAAGGDGTNTATAAGDKTAILVETAKKLCTAGKGLLAADESTGTIGKRFGPIGVENTEDNRRAYRGLLVATAKDMAPYISGVIMYEETLYQKADDGELFVKKLADAGIVTGIKTDKGVREIAGTNGETSTQGLTDLGERCAKYFEAGARFAKWRNVLRIDAAKGHPSQLAIDDMANTLARYASISQAHGIVPIVEPEILMDGAHSIEVNAYHTERALAALFNALHRHRVLLEGTLLKPNMVVCGKDHAKRPTPGDIGMYTVRSLARTVPAALPGVFFLSGGMSEEEASLNLSAVNQQPKAKTWHLSFSYGRALQASCLKAWQGKPENVKAAQDAFLARAKANSEAQLGTFKGSGDAAANESLFVADYAY